MSEPNYDPTKLKEFLAGLDNYTPEPTTDKEDDIYEDGYSDGYKDGQAAMYELLMSLTAEQQKILHKFCNAIFLDGLEQ
jgi:flagellar biosynthesis/type III secretory pathway protein FliH